MVNEVFVKLDCFTVAIRRAVQRSKRELCQRGMFTISCLCNFFESLFRSGRIAGFEGSNCGKIAGVLPRIGMRVLICNLLELLVGLFGALFRSQKTLLPRVNRSIGLTKRRHIGTQRASHGLAGPL